MNARRAFGAVFLLLAALASGAPASRAGEASDEIRLNRSRTLADLLAVLTHPEPGATPESQSDLIDHIKKTIEETGTCFFRNAAGRPREVRRELLARFHGLPAEVREAYRHRVDPAARLLWARGRAGNAAPLQEILDRYPLSSFAPAASRLLARKAAEAGDWDRALILLRDATPPGRAPAPGDALLASFCQRKRGLVRRAEALAREAEERLPPPAPAKRLATKLLAPPPASTPEVPEAGGFTPGPRRRFPLGPLAFPPARRARLRRRGLSPPPTGFSLRRDGTLFLATPAGVRALDAASGELQWAFPDTPRAFASGRRRGSAARPVLQNGRLAVSFGSFLAVFDAGTGKLLWHFGRSEIVPVPPGAPPAGEEGLPLPDVLSAPVPFRGDWLVAMTAGRGASEAFLLRFAPGGSLRWRLFLASGPSARRFRFSPRPAMTAAGGVAYVASGLGTLFAVRADGPRFLWARLHERFSRDLQEIHDRRGRLPRSLAPVYASPLVYLPAQDAGRLFALDGLNGETAWTFELPPGAILAGVQGDRLFLRGPEAILALDRWGGRLAWRAGVPGSEGTGTPALTAGRIHVPGDGGLYSFEATTGKRAALLELPRAREGPWNLSAFSGGMLAAGFEETIELRDVSSPRLDPPGRALALLSEDRAAEARALLLEADGTPRSRAEPAVLEAGAVRAARRGDLASARAFLRALLETGGQESEAACRALIAVGRAEAGAGDAAGALGRFRDVFDHAKGVITPGGDGFLPAATVALAEFGKRAGEAASLSILDASGRQLLALSGEDALPCAPSFPGSAYPLSPAPVEALRRRSRPGGVPEQRIALWNRGVSGGADAAGDLRALAAMLRAVSPDDADRVRGRLPDGGRAFSGRFPRLWGWPLTRLRHEPASAGPLFRLDVAGRPGAGVPGELYGGGRDFIERIDPQLGSTLWRRYLGSWVREAVRVGDALVVGCGNAVTALDPGTGEALWTSPVFVSEVGAGIHGEGGQYRMVPGRSCAAVVFRTGKAVGFNASTGQRAWEARLRGAGYAAVIQDPEGGRVWVFHPAGTATALDPDGGSLAVEKEPPGGSVVDTGGGTAVFLSVAGRETRVRLVEAEGCRTRWEATVSGTYGTILGGAPDGVLVLVPRRGASRASSILGLDASDGRVRWRLPGGRGRRAVEAGSGLMILEAPGSRLEGFDAATGARLWSARVEEFPPAGGAVALSPFTLAWGTPSGALCFLDARTGSGLGRKGSWLGAISQLSWLGPRCLLVTGARGTALFGAPPRPEDFLPLVEGKGGWRNALREQACFLARGRPWAGVRSLARALDARDRLDIGPSDTAHRILVGAVEGASFHSRPSLAAPRFAEPPLPDGVLEEAWSSSCAVDLRVSSLRFLPGGSLNHRWTGESDLSATVYAGWDESFFYVAVEVRDDHPRWGHDPHRSTWTGDVIFFALDRMGNGGFRRDHRDDTIRWVFWPKDPGGGGGRENEREKKERRRRGAKPRPGGPGFVMELAFSWEEDFNEPLRMNGLRAHQIVPAPGKSFGFNLLLLDDDGDGPEHYLALAPGLPLVRSRSRSFVADVWPALWSKVVLE